MSQKYKVTWKLDVVADTPRGAANFALALMTSPYHTAKVLDVDGQLIDAQHGDPSTNWDAYPTPIAELVRDQDDLNVFRVEAIAADGTCQVSTFSGQGALERAILFADLSYPNWTDPNGIVLEEAGKGIVAHDRDNSEPYTFKQYVENLTPKELIDRGFDQGL